MNDCIAQLFIAIFLISPYVVMPTGSLTNFSRLIGKELKFVLICWILGVYFRFKSLIALEKNDDAGNEDSKDDK